MTQRTPMPDLQFAPGPCPQCGAETAIEAEMKCSATQQLDGDYSCAGDDAAEDLHGHFSFPTAASLAALERWYDEDGRRSDGEQAVQKSEV